MNKSDSIVKLTLAVINVMADVEGIEKNLNVGTGSATYKGVADQDVKKIIGESMKANGLAIFPTGIEETTNIDSWDETGQYGTKRKQTVFTKVKTSYLLCHSSGEYIEIAGYGHGVDSQDKSAGKATTYALKYALLYTFLVPTGKIDDADNTHSEDIKTKEKPALTPLHPKWGEVITWLKDKGTINALKSKYSITPEIENVLKTEMQK